MTLLDRARQIITGARAYRFEGEQENHADLLRERRVSLSMMETADAEDPDQTRMATEIEHDAEARLTVLLGKPRLTLEEKRERDAIQAAISARRQGFSGNVLVPREGVETGPKRFLGAIGGIQLWQALAVGWAVTFGLLGVQTARVASLKGDVREMADTARENAATAHRWQERAEEYREGLIDAAGVAREAANALEAERLANVRRAERERRRNREVANVLARSPDAPEWRLRESSGQTEGDGTTP